MQRLFPDVFIVMTWGSAAWYTRPDVVGVAEKGPNDKINSALVFAQQANRGCTGASAAVGLLGCDWHSLGETNPLRSGVPVVRDQCIDLQTRRPGAFSIGLRQHTGRPKATCWAGDWLVGRDEGLAYRICGGRTLPTRGFVLVGKAGGASVVHNELMRTTISPDEPPEPSAPTEFMRTGIEPDEPPELLAHSYVHFWGPPFSLSVCQDVHLLRGSSNPGQRASWGGG